MRGVTPGSPIRPIQRPAHLIPSHSGAAAKEDTTGRLWVEHLHRARTPNFRPTKRGTTFADFGFGAGPLLTRRRAKMNLDWGSLVPPTPSACWDNPPFLFGMGCRPGTALCDVVPGSSVFAGEEKVPVETRIAG
ncbi:hypothetical protein BDZ91DRAFT_765662 [Kalaharituber pfeilii]|nr:hypothetical protein BDZ91DRAFT_765662 [Kalaharituber pfeilii]